jgi:hypothetical protein
MDCLKTLATMNSSITPIHVSVPAMWDRYHDNVCAFVQGIPPAPMTFDFCYISIWQHYGAIHAAYQVGGVIKFSIDPLEGGQLMSILVCGIESILNGYQNKHPSRVYLCDVSRLILSPQELVTVDKDANHTAKAKVFNACRVRFGAVDLTASQRWEYYDSRIKYVDAGFRPSAADVAAIMEARSAPASSSTRRQAS